MTVETGMSSAAGERLQ